MIFLSLPSKPFFLISKVFSANLLWLFGGMEA